MKINYDKTADAVYIRVKKGTVKKTAHLSGLVNADLDKNGKILGIEILGTSLKFKATKNLKYTINIPMLVNS